MDASSALLIPGTRTETQPTAHINGKVSLSLRTGPFDAAARDGSRARLTSAIAPIPQPASGQQDVDGVGSREILWIVRSHHAARTRFGDVLDDSFANSCSAVDVDG
jgi:hypothetical protein